jgi:hypothetical protein
MTFEDSQVLQQPAVRVRADLAGCVAAVQSASRWLN